MKKLAITVAAILLAVGAPGLAGAQTRGQSPPGAPNTVIAAPAGQGAAYVFWSMPYAGSSPITQFVITAYSGLTPVTQKTVPLGGGTFFSTKFGGLGSGIYTFTVAAVNTVGQGVPSRHSNPVRIAAPAPAPSPAGVQISSHTAVPGQSVTVTGGGFPPASEVQVSAVVQLTDGTLFTISTTVPTNGAGQFSATLPLPANVAGGTYTVVAQSLSTGLALTLTLYIVGPTPTPTPTPSPTIAFTVAVAGLDQALWVNHGSGFIYLGGTLIAAPAVVALPNGDHLYIVTGIDHQLWVRSDTVGWQLLGPSYCQGKPAANLMSGILTVACQGIDHALWAASAPLPAVGLPTVASFTSLGGATAYGVATAPVAGTLTYFVTGSDYQIWYRTLFSGWQAIPSVCTSRPAAASDGTTTYLACRGIDGSLWYATDSGGGWSGFQSLGGQLIDGPGGAATPSGPVFAVEGGDRAIYWYAITSGAPSGWQRLGGGANYGASVAAP